MGGIILLTAKYLSGDKGTLFLGEGPLFSLYSQRSNDIE